MRGDEFLPSQIDRVSCKAGLTSSNAGQNDSEDSDGDTRYGGNGAVKHL
jgi:hypothetical protein